MSSNVPTPNATDQEARGFFGGLTALISSIQDIVRAIYNLSETLSGTFASLTGNNTFTGSNFFEGAIGFNTRVVTAAGAVTMSSTDIVIIVNKTVGAATTVTLVASPATDRVIWVKDGRGDALTNPITIDGNGKLIDGQATLVIFTNYQRALLVYNGNEWNQLS